MFDTKGFLTIFFLHQDANIAFNSSEIEVSKSTNTHTLGLSRRTDGSGFRRSLHRPWRGCWRWVFDGIEPLLLHGGETDSRGLLDVEGLDPILLRVEAMRRIQMESNSFGVGGMDPSKQLGFPITAGATDENHARSLEILVDLGSQRLLDRNLQTGSKSGTGTIAGIGGRGFDSVMTGASPGSAATDSVFLQSIQLRNDAFQRRDRGGGAFR